MQKKAHILVVDDEYTNRFLIAEMLENYDIELAFNGESMWNSLEKQTPDIILLDVMMPGEDGFSLAKKLSTHEIYKSIPIIFVTAKISGGDIDEGFKSGAYDYIKKPFNQQELETRITKALETTRQKKELITKAITGDMVFDAMLHGLFITNKDFKILSINSAGSDITGYREQDVQSTFLPDIICDAEQKPIAIGKLVNQRNDVYLVTCNQSMLPVSLSISLISNDLHQELGWVCLFTDISERKAIEHNLQIAQQKVEEAEKTKASFLANMSHEIRTPLNSILGFTELLSDTSLSQEEKSKYMQIIKKNGEQLLAFIDNLLDMSSFENQKIELQLQNCNPAELCSAVENMGEVIQKKLEKAHIHFCIKQQIPENLYLITDEKRLLKCIYNILENAFKFTEKGEVNIVCKIDDTQEYIDIIISDTGVGIAPEMQNKIFNTFKKTIPNNEPQSFGIGLGLGIAKNIIKLLHGTIRVQSQLGVGSIFTIRLPLAL